MNGINGAHGKKVNGTTENGQSPSSPKGRSSSRAASPELGPVENEYSEFSLNELINGTEEASKNSTSESPESFIGLIPLISAYLDSLNVDVETRCELNLYLSLVSKRASGELKTTSTWMREFVRSHKDYKGDSRVTKEINFDMIKKLDSIQEGKEEAPGFLPKWYAERQKGFAKE